MVGSFERFFLLEIFGFNACFLLVFGFLFCLKKRGKMK